MKFRTIFSAEKIIQTKIYANKRAVESLMTSTAQLTFYCFPFCGPNFRLSEPDATKLLIRSSIKGFAT